MPRMRKLSEIRWYLYRSASKLQMLYDQLVATKGPIAGNIAVEVPGISASLGTSPHEEPSEDEKLHLIEEELRDRNLIGTIEEPREYFAGELPMRWGLFNDHGTRPPEEPALVFFGGLDKTNPIVVGLGGSSKHVVGHDGASSTHSRSNTSTIARWLLAGLEDGQPPASAWEPEVERQLVFEGVAIAVHYLRPPTQKLQFLAKTLLSGTVHGLEHMTGFPKCRVILGTPLYVAMAEPLQDEDRWGLDDQW